MQLTSNSTSSIIIKNQKQKVKFLTPRLGWEIFTLLSNSISGIYNAGISVGLAKLM